MSIFNEILSNHVMTTAFIAWFVAQTLKLPFDYFRFGKIKFSRFIGGAGGMPSSHSALMVSSCVAVCETSGVGSVEFAIMFIMSLVVMYDASGVRRAAGEQAKVLNKILEDWSNPALFETKLKELLGHTPFEVLMGAIVGLVVGLLY